MLCFSGRCTAATAGVNSRMHPKALISPSSGRSHLACTLGTPAPSRIRYMISKNQNSRHPTLAAAFVPFLADHRAKARRINGMVFRLLCGQQSAVFCNKTPSRRTSRRMDIKAYAFPGGLVPHFQRSPTQKRQMITAGSIAVHGVPDVNWIVVGTIAAKIHAVSAVDEIFSLFKLHSPFHRGQQRQRLFLRHIHTKCQLRDMVLQKYSSCLRIDLSCISAYCAGRT